MKYIFVFLFCFSLVYSQNSPVSITGKVIDKNGNKVSGELKFTSSAGNVSKTKIGSDETYSFPCKSGDSYTISLTNYIIEDKDKDINVASQNEFKEFTRDLKVEKIVEGRKIMSFSAFKPNDSLFQNSASSLIKELYSFVKFQPNIAYNLYINLSDCKFKPLKSKKTVMEGKKKKTITSEISVQDQIEKVYQARVNNIKAAFLENKIRVMSFTFLKDENVIQTNIVKDKKADKKADKKDKKSSTFPNVRITVSKVRD